MGGVRCSIMLLINSVLNHFYVRGCMSWGDNCSVVDLFEFISLWHTLPTAEIISGKNARAWVSMVLYLKK